MRGHPRLLVPSPPRLGVVRPPWTSPETSTALLRSLRLHRSPCVPPKALPRYQLAFRDNSGTETYSQKCPSVFEDGRANGFAPATKSSRAEMFLLFGHPPSEQHHAWRAASY